MIAKKELLYVWPFGLAAWLCGLVFIDKKNVVASRKIMKSAMERLKVEKIKLWVFPEGKKSFKVILVIALLFNFGIRLSQGSQKKAS